MIDFLVRFLVSLEILLLLEDIVDEFERRMYDV